MCGSITGGDLSEMPHLGGITLRVSTLQTLPRLNLLAQGVVCHKD